MALRHFLKLIPNQRKARLNCTNTIFTYQEGGEFMWTSTFVYCWWEPRCILRSELGKILSNYKWTHHGTQQFHCEEFLLQIRSICLELSVKSLSLWHSLQWQNIDGSTTYGMAESIKERSYTAIPWRYLKPLWTKMGMRYKIKKNNDHKSSHNS